jgi:hypothetical protein
MLSEAEATQADYWKDAVWPPPGDVQIASVGLVERTASGGDATDVQAITHPIAPYTHHGTFVHSSASIHSRNSSSLRQQHSG